MIRAWKIVSQSLRRAGTRDHEALHPVWRAGPGCAVGVASGEGQKGLLVLSPDCLSVIISFLSRHRLTSAGG